MSRFESQSKSQKYLNKENAPPQKSQNIESLGGAVKKLQISDEKILNRQILSASENKNGSIPVLLRSQSVQTYDRGNFSTTDWLSQSKFKIFNEAATSKTCDARQTTTKALKNQEKSTIGSQATEKNTSTTNKEKKFDRYEKSSTFAFQRAKNFFITKELEESKRKSNDLCTKIKIESHKVQGVLQKQLSLDSDFKFSGKLLVNPRIEELKAAEKQIFKETPPFFLNNPPKIEKVKVLHRQGDIEGHSLTHLKDTKLISRDLSYCSTYNKDIIEYYHEIETKRAKNSEQKLNLTFKQRQTIVTSLIINMTSNSYPSSALYMAVRIFEDVLRVRFIPVEKLELVALAALWIAIKRDAVTYVIPSAEKVASFSGGAFKGAEIRKYECDILSILSFNLAYTDPSFVITYCIVANNLSKFASDEKIARAYYYGSYMIDLALLDDELMAISPLLLATTAGEIAISLIMQPDDLIHLTDFSLWRCDYAKRNFRDHEIFNTRSMLVKCIIKSRTSKSFNRFIFKKYKRSRYGAIADEFLIKISKLIP